MKTILGRAVGLAAACWMLGHAATAQDAPAADEGLRPPEAPPALAPGTAPKVELNLPQTGTNAVAPGGETPAPEPDAGIPALKEGYYQMRVGNADAAVESFRTVLKEHPDNKRAMFGLGTALISLQKEAEAAKVLEKAMERYPKDYFIRNNLAWLYATASDVQLRDGKRAIALAQEALLLAPQDFHVWSTLAEAYYVAGKYNQALRTAKEAYSLARQQGLDETSLREYTRQVDKCRQAEQAMTILE